MITGRTKYRTGLDKYYLEKESLTANDNCEAFSFSICLKGMRVSAFALLRGR